jgi:hypothetical protein
VSTAQLPNRASRRALQRGIAPAVALAAAAGVVGCLLLRDPNDAGAYPLCPFRALTGWDCPGCGALRGMRALAGGDVALAVDQNLLVVVAAPFLLWRWLTWSRSRLRGDPPSGWAVPAPVIHGLLVATLLFWLVRNVPGAPLLPSGVG